ncbi:MAG: hypothetical protein ACRC2K_07960 [Clostridium sp.]
MKVLINEVINITTIYLSKPDECIKKGEIFDVYIKIKDIPPLQSILGFHNLLIFNPRFISVLDYDVSCSILNPILFPPIIKIDNCGGIVDFNVGRKNSYIGVMGGVIYKLKCRANENGCTEIINKIADLRDYSGARIFTKNYSLSLSINVK